MVTTKMQNVMIEIENITTIFQQGHVYESNDFRAMIKDPGNGRQFFSGSKYDNAKDACREAVEYIVKNNKPYNVVKTMCIERSLDFDN
jgi:hypothetical protein